MFLLCVICVHKYCEFLSSFVRHRRCSDGWGALSVGEMEWCGTAPGRTSTRVASWSWLLPHPYLRRGTGLHSRTFPFSLLDQGTSPDNSCANHTSFPKFWNWAHIVVAVLWSPVKVGAKAGIWVGAAHLGALYAEEQRETIERNKCGARRDKRASQRERQRDSDNSHWLFPVMRLECIPSIGSRWAIPKALYCILPSTFPASL